ncbi:MAG: hypothetical protein K2K81_07425 [Muribaculaceae bacterium]|nr:hypothetical protein [Muribaculaceae bacterium]
MRVRAEEMVKDVRVAIDMNRGDAPLLMEGDTDTLTLDEIIYAKLLDAVRLVEMEAPIALLESGHDFGPVLPGINPGHGVDSPLLQHKQESSLFIGDDGKGFIILPEDFMRLIAFRMNDWKRTVFEAISESDPRYALQSSRWKGICGNPEKPVVAVVRRSEGLVLEFYSCRSRDATVAQAAYLPYPRIDGKGCIDIPEGCYRGAVYRAAALALASYGDQLSSSMLEISRSLLQGG